MGTVNLRALIALFIVTFSLAACSWSDVFGNFLQGQRNECKYTYKHCSVTDNPE